MSTTKFLQAKNYCQLLNVMEIGIMIDHLRQLRDERRNIEESYRIHDSVVYAVNRVPRPERAQPCEADHCVHCERAVCYDHERDRE
jgi:hypothetical protein